MPDIQQIIPQMPQAQLPGGIQSAPIVPPNPLGTIGAGIQSGFGMGLQNREVQIKQQQADTQAKYQQAEIEKATLDSAHQTFESISKINPDAAMDYYHQKVAPLQDAFWQKHGLSMDSKQIPPSHANADIIQQINDATDMVANDPTKLVAGKAILSHLSNQMNVSEYASKRIKDSGQTMDSMQDYQKNQEGMFNQFKQTTQGIRGDTNYKQLETQRNAAAQGYTALKNSQDANGNYNMTNAEIIDMYSQLYKAQNGTDLAPGAVKDLNSMSIQKLWGKTAALVGMTPNSLPQAVGDRAQQMFTQAGSFSEAQHASMLSSKSVIPPGVDPTMIPAYQAELKRGMTFQQMKQKADMDYQQRIQGKQGLVWQGRQLKDTAANRAWIAAQQGGQQ